eukprot:m.354532 g.354532  ORF g.354532 m.354532 type:complete len:608 (+) comp17048_c0_seq1:73-1896(+)
MDPARGSYRASTRDYFLKMKAEAQQKKTGDASASASTPATAPATAPKEPKKVPPPVGAKKKAPVVAPKAKAPVSAPDGADAKAQKLKEEEEREAKKREDEKRRYEEQKRKLEEEEAKEQAKKDEKERKRREREETIARLRAEQAAKEGKPPPSAAPSTAAEAKTQQEEQEKEEPQEEKKAEAVSAQEESQAEPDTTAAKPEATTLKTKSKAKPPPAEDESNPFFAMMSSPAKQPAKPQVHKCEALLPYTAKNDKELSFEKGATIYVTARDLSTPMLKGVYNQKQGKFPGHFVKSVETGERCGDKSQHFKNAVKCRCLGNYTAKKADELTLSQGDVVHVPVLNNNPMVKVVHAGKAGFVPRRLLLDLEDEVQELQAKTAEMTLTRCKAVRAHHPGREGWLDFDVFDVVIVPRPSQDAVWEGVCKGNVGKFPVEYVVDTSKVDDEEIERLAAEFAQADSQDPFEAADGGFGSSPSQQQSGGFDPFAPQLSQAEQDPFAPQPSSSAEPDPFAPQPTMAAAATAEVDPFMPLGATSSQAEPDPFAPQPPSSAAPDPFAPQPISSGLSDIELAMQSGPASTSPARKQSGALPSIDASQFAQPKQGAQGFGAF